MGRHKRGYKNNSHRDKQKRHDPYANYKTTKPMSFAEIHKGCIDKVRFHSRKTVRSAAKEKGQRYYRCPFCNEWHLTKSKGAINPWNEDIGYQNTNL